MYYTVASKMVVTSSSFSQAVSMAGANTALAEFTNFGGTTGSAIMQEGNDLENWVDSNAGVATAAVGTGTAAYGTVKATAVASRYVRIKFTAGAGSLILGAGINTSQQ